MVKTIGDLPPELILHTLFNFFKPFEVVKLRSVNYQYTFNLNNNVFDRWNTN